MTALALCFVAGVACRLALAAGRAAAQSNRQRRSNTASCAYALTGGTR